MRRKMFCLILVLALASAGAFAENAVEDADVSSFAAVNIEEKGLELGESSVTYPALTGLSDEALEEQVNAQIRSDTGAAEYAGRLGQLLSGGSLRVDWTGGLPGPDVFSCAMFAQGDVEPLRSGFFWTWSNIDLRDGHEIELSELFTSEEEAREVLEEYLEDQVAPELSAMLFSSALLPLPEGFFIEREGLTLLYPADQFRTLSDRAGAVRIGWNELRQVLDLREDGIPDRIGVPEMIGWTDQSADRIREMTENGAFPDIPVTLGDGLQALTDRYGLLTDPDVYEGGRMFAPEGACFRGVFLLTDFLSEDWDQSVVQGVRVEQGCAFGLCVGETLREEWRRVLGDPDYTVEWDEERAEWNRTHPGTCDYYNFGDHQLQLYADTDGVLLWMALME